jgi:hypothetical protein
VFPRKRGWLLDGLFIHAQNAKVGANSASLILSVAHQFDVIERMITQRQGVRMSAEIGKAGIGVEVVVLIADRQLMRNDVIIPLGEIA